MREFVRIFDDNFNGLVVADMKCLGYDNGYLTYYIPNSLTHGQLHGVLTDVFEQTSYGFIVGESSGRGEYVVLKESNSGMSDLCGEIARLAFAQSEMLLTIFENYFYRPTHCVNMVCFVEVKQSIGGQDATPRGMLAVAHIKQAHGYVFYVSIHDNVMTVKPAAVLHTLGLGGKLADDCFRRVSFSIFRERESHAFLTHFNHAQIITFDSSSLDEPDNLFTGKPTVSQEVIKSISAFDGSANHFFKQLNLTLDIIIYAFGCGTLLDAYLFESPIQLSRRHGMVAALARLADKFEINYHLTLTIANGEYQRLEAEYHLVTNMTENATNLLSMNTSLWIIRIIDNKANRLRRIIGTHGKFAPELTGYMVHDFAPVENIVVDKPIKHIFRCAA